MTEADSEPISETLNTIAMPVPVEAVIAFNLSTGCPKGWVEYTRARGRSIIGASSASMNPETKLDTYDFNDIGGAEYVVLEAPQLPNHKHDFIDTYFSGSSESIEGKESEIIYEGMRRWGSAGIDDDNTWWQYNSETAEFGDGKKIAVRSPFVALYYCQPVPS